MEDIIGREPTREANAELDRCLCELESKTGLGSVKSAVLHLVNLAQNNYRHEVKGERTEAVLLNRLFVGNPGTGKTTIAKIYARILKALRLLSRGDLVYRTASDFIGEAVGETQRRTRSILEVSQGNVLFIDEAYNLDDGMYGKQAIDTIVEVIQGDPGEDIALILAGYEGPLLKMVRIQNPGLARRVNSSHPIRFDDFSDLELLQILSRECEKMDAPARLPVKKYAVKKLSKLRSLPNFGNAGTLIAMLSEAKARMTERLRKAGETAAKNGGTLPIRQLEAVDFEGENEERDPFSQIRKLFGADHILKWMERLAARIQVRHREGRALDGLVGNMIFLGSAGTGKTTAAQLFGEILFSFGVLSSHITHTAEAADFPGQYLGQTKEKVKEIFEAARGGVLVIERAEALGDGDGFSREAVRKMEGMLREERNRGGGTIVILTGERESLEWFLARNEGVRLHFRDVLEFPDWDEEKCADFVVDRLLSAKPAPYQFQSGSNMRENIVLSFAKLKGYNGWENIRTAEKMLHQIEMEREIRLSLDFKRSFGVTAREVTEGDVRVASAKVIEDQKRYHKNTFPRSKDALPSPPLCPSPQSAFASEKGLSRFVEKQRIPEEIPENPISESEDVFSGVREHSDIWTEVRPPIAAAWEGMDLSDLSLLNEVIESFEMNTESGIAALMRKGTEYRLLIEDLSKKVGCEEKAKGITEDYFKCALAARRVRERTEQLRRLEMKEAFKTAKAIRGKRKILSKRPVIQCQMCGKTGNYWAPCFVAPVQIGEEDFVIGYEEYVLGYEHEEAELVI